MDDATNRADTFLRQGDPQHLRWRATGQTRTRRRLWWMVQQREETRLSYSTRKGWFLKTRWVRA